MAQYIAATANGQAVIINAITGVIVNARAGRNGRKYVQLWYNGKRHTHTLAHAWACLLYNLPLDECKALHVHHIDQCRTNDAPTNYAIMCGCVHSALHRICGA